MSLTNPGHVVTEQRLAEFYQQIYPYLGGGSSDRGVVYGFRINDSESVPSAKVTYLADATWMTPAYMDYTNNTFNYGSWEDAFFMPKPCMLKYDGTVDYYLDPNDYTKKADGVTSSDVANTSYEGNAMMEWPKVWLKIQPDPSNSSSANIYISDHQADPLFTDWPFHNCNGNSVNHFYTAIYNGSLINSKLRSLSGQQVMNSKTAAEEVTAATANNLTASEIWNIEKKSDIDLITMLLVLITKTTNLQSAIGKGFVTGGSESVNNGFRTGVHNTKGLFYGTNSGTISSGSYGNAVKVFGMENWWGFHWRRYLGYVLVNGAHKVKLTYGQEDGSTLDGFNLTGDNYSSLSAAAISGTGDYISKIKYEHGTFVPITSVQTGSTVNYCDGCAYNNSIIAIASRGWHSACDDRVGPFGIELNAAATSSGWARGTSLSAKPLS